jgi:hypothetical protein
MRDELGGGSEASTVRMAKEVGVFPNIRALEWDYQYGMY